MPLPCRIKAETYVVPFSRDMFFSPADCQAEQKPISNSEFRMIDSVWAHFAMFCMTDSERKQVDACIAEMLKDRGHDPRPMNTVALS